MTREQAINSMITHGFKVEQVGEIIKAVTDKPTTKNDIRDNRVKSELNRVKNELEPITKNDSSGLEKNSKKLEKDFGELDCIDRAELLKAMNTWDKFGNDPNEGLIPLRTPALQDRYVPYVKYDDMIKCVKAMPSVTPQEQQTFKWCETCKEYDQEKHCCHRWSKVIRDTVEEMKQEYIEREVLDKIRVEIMTCLKALDDIEKSGLNIYLPNEMSGRRLTYQQCIGFIDKYKADKEQTDGNVD